MQEIKFNYCIPREYKDKETNEIKYAICRGNEKMNIATLNEIQKYADSNKPKNAQPWIQNFTNGYRVVTESIDYNDWNGVTFSDVDSKYFYKYCKPFDVEKLLNAIYEAGQYIYNGNFYAVHLTNSKQGYRIFWYWDCKRTEDNFKKCCILSEKYTKEMFYGFGEQGKQIIDFNYNGHKVLDHCSNSIMQGSYVTVNKIYYSEFTDSEQYGKCELEDIKIEQLYKINNIQYKSKELPVEYKGKEIVSKENLRYYPHSHRRCIYEALIRLFKDKEKVDKEWEYVANLLPETDDINAGHPTKFYINEPNRNKWYELYFKNKNVVHRIDWLIPFGYKYNDPNEYIYINQFKKSWKKHCIKKLNDLYIEENKNKDLSKKSDIEDNIKDIIENIDEEAKYDVFNSWWNTNIKDQKTLEDIRNNYYKNQWNNKDFIYLTNGYKIPDDIVTYKMYADLYYRNSDNETLLKYDVLEDEVKTYGYWTETNKIQWHPFKYNDELTHWKNNDTFSNKASKNDLTYAVNKYAARWYNYHSIKEYFYSLDLSKIDEDLLETWAIRYFNCDDTKLTREICKKYLIAAVKKIFVNEPSSFVFQHMLFLQGATGCGKTFFLNNMFTINNHSYILNKIDPNGKDNEIGPLIAKNWMIQFGESENLKKVSVNAAKEFVDRINMGMKYQKKYENEQTTVYPRIVMCRTSNDDVLFNDISISDGDRRNWLLVCKTGINACDENLRNQMKQDKDILWATAYKLYLDNPGMDLELSNETFSELANLQEQFKLIKTDDIKEIYDEIFERLYLTNSKGEIEDYYSFYEMLKRNDTALERHPNYTSGFFDDNIFTQEKHITRIPARWIADYVKSKYGSNTMTLLKKMMINNGWTNKTAGYLKGTLKCWCK